MIFFGKHIESLVGHGENIIIPDGLPGKSLDYEGELAVVIGKPGYQISVKQAMNHIFGFTLINDGSVRHWQKHSVFAGKNFNRSGSCGPYLLTKDMIPDPQNLELTTKLNKSLVQNTNTKDMIYSICEQIAYVSNIFDLESGDILSTGSPDGTGASQNPERFLREGDHLEVEIPNIGILSNTIKTKNSLNMFKPESY